MGAHLAQRHLCNLSKEPDPLRIPTFPPDYGFSKCKEREMVLILQQRDYCAHYLTQLLKYKCYSFLNFLACKHEQHYWDYREHLDYMKFMKEFEREQRLLQRKKRWEQKWPKLDNKLCVRDPIHLVQCCVLTIWYSA
uniref:NADH dehydrogenase [ubiquinone] 1 beta subcomplex subunit 7 n=1 Tax=Catagonus wagneri TaxID=51154 RepID=A0A8C3VHY1_9CETA